MILKSMFLVAKKQVDSVQNSDGFLHGCDACASSDSERVSLVIECGRCYPCLGRRALSPHASAMTMQLWAYASNTIHETASCTSKGGRITSCRISEI